MFVSRSQTGDSPWLARGGDREAKRTAMWQDPAWIAYTQESAKLGALEAQENKLMQPVGFHTPKR